MYRSRHLAPLVDSLNILAHTVNGVRDLEEVVLRDVHRRCELRRDLAQLRADDVVLHTQKKILASQPSTLGTNRNSEKSIYLIITC